MPTWNSEQYLQFAKERTQPARDLAARVTIAAPGRIADLGCGPGNSTAVVAQRWPQAAILGIDTSTEMLESARRSHPEWQWLHADVTTWANEMLARRERWDVVFSNASLQWVPNHAALLGTLFGIVASGGALTFQLPYTQDLPHQRCMRELAGAWRNRFIAPPTPWHVEPAEFYYDALAPNAAKLDLWVTDYAHVLPGPEAIVDWYRSTGLRPYLDALPDDTARAAFLSEYLAAITPHHPRRADGNLLLYFRRLFVIAYAR